MSKYDIKAYYLQYFTKCNFIMLLFISIIFAFIGMTEDSYASAWLQNDNYLQMIFTNNYSHNDLYSKGYKKLYLEYGMNRKTIGLNLYNKENTRYNTDTYYKDNKIINLFIKKKLYEKNKYIISSEKILYIKPLGYQHKVSFGYNFDNVPKAFIDTSFSIMKNYIDPVNINIDSSFGIHIDDKFNLLAQIFNNYRHYKFKSLYIDENSQIFNRTIVYKNLVSNISTSAIYKLNNTYSVQVGISKKILSKAKINNFFISLWIDNYV